ncbi:SCO6880 family protein [Nocardia yamanashiensis]|uniref:SCO6880 family protein n=1 Tax=Nocardia yamanashiensis TaxID=209247 RepID=UPI000A045538|nr:SCO6880 family protein [Nocardia yamanashiensis]
MVEQQMRPDAQRTYGSGHEVRRVYAFGLPRKVFIALAISVILGLVLTMLGFKIFGLVWATCSVLAGIPMSVRIMGKTGYELALLEWAWSREKKSGRNILRAGPLSHAPGGRTRLPGVGAGTEMWWGVDKYGRRFGMIRMPQTGQYTAVLRCSPRGVAGMEQDVVNMMVAQWGNFLKRVGEPGDVAGVVTVVETIPETGARLRMEMARITHPHAPDFAKEFVSQAGAGRAADRSGHQVHVRMSITWNARTEAKRKDPMVMVGDLANRLPELCGLLAGCQVVAEPMSDYEISATVRRCYDPRVSVETAVEGLVRHRGNPPEGEFIDWVDAGPLDADALLDRQTYVHDGAFSRTWVMGAPPSGFFSEAVLTPLLVGRSDVPRKRIALIHRPLPPAEAAESVHADLLSARAEVSTTRAMASAGAELKVVATNQARSEQALGAGVTDYGLLITVTASSLSELEEVGDIAKDMSQAAQMKIRPAWNQQPAAFLAALGVGVLLPDHATVGKTLKGE